MAKLINCKTCQAEIAANAKTCPKCGAKNKKPFYKKWWVWVIAVFVVAGIGSSGDEDKSQLTNQIVSNGENLDVAGTGSAEAQEGEIIDTGVEQNLGTTISEQVLLDYDGLKITAKSYEEDSFLGEGIKLLIENNSQKDYGIGCRALIVNNYMITDLFSSTVAAGKKVNETMYLMSSELEAAGIENIGQVEVYFYLYDDTNYNTIYEAPGAVIKTSDFEKMDTTPNDAGTELYNQNGIRIVGKFVDETSVWGSAVLLYLENNSGKNIGINCDDLSINGFMVTPIFSSTLYAGKMAIDDITLLSSELEENGIEKVENVELKFHIYDEETYNTIADTDVISFAVS